MEESEATYSKQPLLADSSLNDNASVDIDESQIRGLIEVPGSAEAQNGKGDEDLDEPVWRTIKRDLDSVSEKFFLVLKPKSNQQLLRNWDLWGPLFLCVLMSMFLHDGSGSLRGPQFTEAFIVIWCGACVVTINTKLLGGNISFFQTLCVLGYCLLPLALALVVCQIMFLTMKPSLFLFVSRSTAFLAHVPPPHRKALVVYPVVLFYLIITWMIISQNIGSA
ncbi:unnamed protein product [Soboliphyme baturini]|uniref:Protein YIPF n=1 Tax=Soboliphyme baturini TaxID=241478 RepID=A0A183J2Q6_9BILA|nr:unnamed protein product [Soboliphyme baturini]